MQKHTEDLLGSKFIRLYHHEKDGWFYHFEVREHPEEGQLVRLGASSVEHWQPCFYGTIAEACEELLARVSKMSWIEHGNLSYTNRTKIDPEPTLEELAGDCYKDKWTALYLPIRSPGSLRQSKYNFDSEDAAKEYVTANMCDYCTQVWAGGEHPGCYFEWEIMPTHEFAGLQSQGETLEIELTAEEITVLRELAAKKELSLERVLRQGLHLLQLEDAGMTGPVIDSRGVGWPEMD